jgi:hypothetical protein
MLTQEDVSFNFERMHQELITRIEVYLEKNSLFNPHLLKLIPSEDPT